MPSVGFEPTLSGFWGRCLYRLGYDGGGGRRWIRTSTEHALNVTPLPIGLGDRKLQSGSRYRKVVVIRAGLEPASSR